MSDTSTSGDTGQARPPCLAATFEGSGCRGTITDGQCSEQDDHHPTPGMLPYDGPGAESADTGQAREPGIAERAAKLGAAVNQERADQLATGLMALADDMRSMAGQWPDNAAARNAYGVAEMRARNLVAADRETENHFRPEPAADTVPAPDDEPGGLEKAFIDGWMACRSAYGATDPEDVDHGVECPRAHGDRECHCNEDAVREWAELEWADRPDTSSAVQAPDVAALLAKCDEIDRQGHSKLRGTFSTADIRALLGADTTPAVAS